VRLAPLRVDGAGEQPRAFKKANAQAMAKRIIQATKRGVGSLRPMQAKKRLGENHEFEAKNNLAGARLAPKCNFTAFAALALWR
jgi:hypothetical protein